MSLGVISTGLGILSSVNSITGGSLWGGGKDSKQEYINYADPFNASRGQYEAQLNNLIANPDSISDDPYYNWLKDQGSETVNRSMAAGGFLDSGNRAIALDEQGQNTASNYFQSKYNQLASLAGVGGTGVSYAPWAAETTAANTGINDLGKMITDPKTASSINTVSSWFAPTTTVDGMFAEQDYGMSTVPWQGEGGVS